MTPAIHDLQRQPPHAGMVALGLLRSCKAPRASLTLRLRSSGNPTSAARANPCATAPQPHCVAYPFASAGGLFVVLFIHNHATLFLLRGCDVRIVGAEEKKRCNVRQA